MSEALGSFSRAVDLFATQQGFRRQNTVFDTVALGLNLLDRVIKKQSKSDDSDNDNNSEERDEGNPTLLRNLASGMTVLGSVFSAYREFSEKQREYKRKSY